MVLILIMPVSLVRIVAGLLLLILGRRLFWLFVGLIGFMTGFTFASRFFSLDSQLLELLIAVGCGLIGVLLAIFLQRLAIAIAGFLAGGLLATTLIEMFSLNVTPAIPFVIGGVLGAVLLSIFFDWALIFISSATGAMLISRSLPVDPWVGAFVFVVLAVIGVLVQTRLLPAAKIRKA
jgi:Domain of unknown function (DUF4203)